MLSVFMNVRHVFEYLNTVKPIPMVTETDTIHLKRKELVDCLEHTKYH